MTFVGHIWLTLHVLASSKLLLVSSEALTTVSAATAAGGGGTGMSNRGEKLLVQPAKISITIGEHSSAEFYTNEALDTDVELTLRSDPNFEATPHVFLMNAKERRKNVTVVGLKITSRTVLEVDKCRYINSTEECPFSNLNRTFVEVTVVHSSALSILVIVVGWIYFVAWSISFYPQIYLNFKRRSVVGLNFDFLVLNIIGFTCYTFYNVLMYFDMNVQDIYERTHPHTHIPVLLNDVVFAVHALFACIVTALQCFFYERGGQRVSYTCSGISSAFILFAVISFILSMTDVINTLQFIMFLSYVKMAVTLCKYFPQAFFNFRRKSTVGWSIGNVLLDFLGGSMDICQMILQAINTDDWSAFYGNPVKFGLGLVSMIFDIVFIIQHYVLYRNKNASLEAPKIDESRATIDANDQSSMEAAPSEDGSSVPIYVDRTNNPIV